jgi:DNA processing protein
MSSRPNQPLTEAERIDWLRLIRSEHVGPVTFHRLLERYRTAAAALAALPRLARQGGRSGVRIPSAEAAADEMARLAHAGGRMLLSADADYPSLLRAIEDAPPVVGLIGDAALLDRASVAIVGSRNASLNGSRFAEQLARDLGAAGFVVVSGLARGIDAAAHQGALATGTIAVLAGGADVIYPPGNTDLYHAIKVHGAIVAEMPAGMPPQARHFPRRNRLISGLSLGVVVVEANLHSGSLITARCALDQGREVFAVPGSPLDPRARGCNALIRQGAVLTESVDDVLNVLAPAGTGVRPAAARLTAAATPAPNADAPPVATESAADAGVDADAARAAILALLSPVPVAVDELVRRCGLPAATVHTALLEWELAGRIDRHPGNRVVLLAPAAGPRL